MNDNEIKRIKQFEFFLDNIFTKTIKGNDYYYIKVDTPIVKKEYYVGAYTKDKVKLEEYFNSLVIKMYLDLLYIIFKENKKLYKSKYITDNEYLELELIRTTYNEHLKQFSKSDLENYEEVSYTKYVYGTTNIEGNTYTLRETELTLNEGITVGGKKLREFYEIRNYAELKEYLSRKKSITFDILLIKKIHSFILKNIDDNYAGEFRKVDVGIRGTEFSPLPAIFVEDEIEKLIKWFNNNKEKMYPVELVAIFHQRFEEIHPFIDGNGRVGRELVRLMLKEYGFPSIFIGPKNREEYLKSIDIGNSGDYKKIVHFFVNCILEMNIKMLTESVKEIISKLNNKKDLIKSSMVMIQCLKNIEKKLKMVSFNEEK